MVHRRELAWSACSVTLSVWVAGINKALKAKGIKEGDVVVVADMELEWSDDQSEGALYGRWLNERKSQGKPLKGTSSWPYAG